MAPKNAARHEFAPSVGGPAFRSAAVARLARLPVATLRIWEQRYQAVQPVTAASGHRLYTPADVARVALLRQLTEIGHSIGTIAPLATSRLQQLLQASLAPAPGSAGQPAGPTRGLALTVAGAALAARLQRAAATLPLLRPLRRVAVFESLADVAGSPSSDDTDLLVWHSPELRPEVPAGLRTAQSACRAARAAVVYRHASAAAVRAHAEAGTIVLREPADDDSLGRWLGSLLPSAAADVTADASASFLARAPDNAAAMPEVPPRRYDDATLTAIAGLRPRLACECPRHIAELLRQLSSFEAYSEGCRQRSTDDAELHRYLQQVAGAARALFEAALERVARHEGLTLR